ncbi:MAG: hypothetical protein BGO99_04430 [Nitrosospira sp. 56-18]|jgi:hypothetical protein|nr:MAG: hypothetical protein BGO99_04430 [Nitrosospira sp. 56-18]
MKMHDESLTSQFMLMPEDGNLMLLFVIKYVQLFPVTVILLWFKDSSLFGLLQQQWHNNL